MCIVTGHIAMLVHVCRALKTISVLSVHVQDRGPLIKDRLAKCSSIKLMEVLQELSQITQELDEVLV